jgi:UDP-galactopyranose mutase
MNFNKYDVIIVGVGLSGIVLGEQLSSKLNKKILIIDKRNHIGGNCYDYVDPETGILMNKYGAHLFHTDDEEVFRYINKFCKWEKWEHKVLGLIDNDYLPIPANITTVNKLCNENITNEEEMNIWLQKNQIKYDKIINGEQMAKSRVGEILYEKIFKHYTYKQWKKYPEELAPEVLARIPVRNSFDDRYFSDKYQVLPKRGYTNFFQCILEKNKDNIDVKLNTDFFDIKDKISKEQIVIYTGPIDAYFADKGLPKLEYRSIDFHIERKMNTKFYQPYSVVNYPNEDTLYTRCVEYKHFLKQESEHTVYVKETTTDTGEPYYPVLNDRNKELYEKYKKKAENEGDNIHFIGRLASYKYFNMDQAIKNSLDYFKNHFNNIGIIGCCRQKFINNKYNFIPDTIGNVHSTKEIITQLDYMINNNISADETKYVFQVPMLGQKNLIYSNKFKNFINNTNIFLIEIGSIKTYQYNKSFVHHVLYDTPDHLGLSSEIKKNIIKKEQDYNEIFEDIIKIKKILKDKKIIIVTHINPSPYSVFDELRLGCDGKNKRIKLIYYLENICSKLGIICINPSKEITKRGYNISDLVKENDNYLHYNPLGEKIMKQIYKEYLYSINNKLTNKEPNVKLYSVFHNKLSNELAKYDEKVITFIGVNKDVEKIIPDKLNKYHIIYEYNLNKYDKFFQDCGYNESSAIVHVGANNLHKKYEFIGFSQYDNILNTNLNYKKNTCYCISLGFCVIEHPAFPLRLFFDKYNSFFKTNHNIQSLKNLCKNKISNIWVPLLSTFIIHTSIYDELYKFWINFMYDIFYIGKIEKNNIPKHHRHIGGIMERVFGITLVLNEKIEIFENIHHESLNTKQFNYEHNNGDDGDGFQTPSHIIEKYINHKRLI